MSLGLFNCRLIQPAGDQLFFLAGCLAAPAPVRASSVPSPCDASCSAPTSGGAQNASCFSFSERFCLGFQRARSPRRVQEGSTPTDSPTPRRSPNPTHRFCYRAGNTFFQADRTLKLFSTAYDNLTCKVWPERPENVPTELDLITAEMGDGLSLIHISEPT